MTFLTVPLAMYEPAVALESTATAIPPLNLNANVVVPWDSLMRACLFDESTSVSEAR